MEMARKPWLGEEMPMLLRQTPSDKHGFNL
jgi:hypothetical protein